MLVLPESFLCGVVKCLMSSLLERKLTNAPFAFLHGYCARNHAERQTEHSPICPFVVRLVSATNHMSRHSCHAQQDMHAQRAKLN